MAAAAAREPVSPQNEPKKIRTLTIRPDQQGEPANAQAAQPPAARVEPDPAPAPAVQSAAPVRPQRVARAPASEPDSGPINLTPQAGSAPARAAAAPVATGAYLVQVSSQRSEGDAKASFRALQGKFPSVLGSREAVIRRADLGSRGTYYRAMVGPFGNASEASQLCSDLKAAGGQCVIQRN